MQTLGQCSATK